MKSLKWLLSLSFVLLLGGQSSSYEVTFRVIYDATSGTTKYINTNVTVLGEEWITEGDLLTYPTVGPNAWTANWVPPGGWILYKPDGTWETGGTNTPSGNRECENKKLPHIYDIRFGQVQRWEKVHDQWDWVPLKPCDWLKDKDKLRLVPDWDPNRMTFVSEWARDDGKGGKPQWIAYTFKTGKPSEPFYYRDPPDWDVIDLSSWNFDFEFVANSDSGFFATYLLPNSQAGCIPEPVTLILFGVGLLPVLRCARKRN